MESFLKHEKFKVGDYVIDFEKAGNGSPLLLLHGFPETKRAWDKVISRLLPDHTIILPDIPGYGASDGPAPAPDYSNYSKRSIGHVLNLFMKELGYIFYSVAGHDRGARIAYRMALDFQNEVKKIALLNIIPTIEVVERINFEKAYNMENWFFLSQPAPFPEILINANPEFYLNHILDSWSLEPQLISKKSRAEYFVHFRKPAVIERICAEYRAFKIDIQNDKEDRLKGKTIKCPAVALWSQNDFPLKEESPLTIWRTWADNVVGKGLSCGHFLMEEKSDEVGNELSEFFKV
jgi:haloacetate dehalogenase